MELISKEQAAAFITSKGAINPNAIRKRPDLASHGISVPTFIYCSFHQVEPRRCGCGVLLNVESFAKGYRGRFCSIKCAMASGEIHAKAKKTLLDRYGVDNPSKDAGAQQRREETMMERYGVKNRFCLPVAVDPVVRSEASKKAWKTIRDRGGVEEVVGKRRETMMERYGGFYTSTDEYKDRVRKTNLERYGTEWGFQSPIIRDKGNRTMMERYGGHHTKTEEWKAGASRINKERLAERIGPEGVGLLSDPDGLEAAFRTHGVTILSRQLGVCERTIYSRLEDYGIIRDGGTDSSLERHVLGVLESARMDVHRNRRDILPSRREIDLFIPKLYIGIEIHGAYWHAVERKGRWYHWSKWAEAQSVGVRLIQLWETDVSSFTIDWIYPSLQEVVDPMKYQIGRGRLREIVPPFPVDINGFQCYNCGLLLYG